MHLRRPLPGRSAVGRANASGRAEVVHDHVDDALLQRRRTTSRVPTRAGPRRAGPATGALGVHLGQDLVLREVVRGEPDRRRLRSPRRAGPPDPQAVTTSSRTAAPPSTGRGRTAPSSRAGARGGATVTPDGDERGWSPGPVGWSISGHGVAAAGSARSAARGPGQPAGSPAIQRVRSRRRPSGEPPPLPRPSTPPGSGGWRSAGWSSSPGSSSSPRDGRRLRRDRHPVLQAIADIRTPWLTRVAEVAGVLATRRPSTSCGWPTWWRLVVFRRWRHLFVWIGVHRRGRPRGEHGRHPAAAAALRGRDPRLLGRLLDAVAADDGARAPSWSAPLYTLVPAGRCGRSPSGWSPACSSSPPLPALPRPRTIRPTSWPGSSSASPSRWPPSGCSTPNDVYPVRYKRGRPAHLDVTGARGEAIIRALQDQLG